MIPTLFSTLGNHAMSTFNIYTASIPVFKQILTSLHAILEKAETYAAEKKIEPAALLQFRLFPDMLPFTRQIQIACDFAKGAAARLGGQDVPSWADDESSFSELKARIQKTLAYIDSVPRAQIEQGVDRAITTGSGDRVKNFPNGAVYLSHYAFPHFYFHATTAYDILRHNGLEIGKKDFIGSY